MQFSARHIPSHSWIHQRVDVGESALRPNRTQASPSPCRPAVRARSCLDRLPRSWLPRHRYGYTCALRPHVAHPGQGRRADVAHQEGPECRRLGAGTQIGLPQAQEGESPSHTAISAPGSRSSKLLGTVRSGSCPNLRERFTPTSFRRWRPQCAEPASDPRASLRGGRRRCFESRFVQGVCHCSLMRACRLGWDDGSLRTPTNAPERPLSSMVVTWILDLQNAPLSFAPQRQGWA